MPRSSKEAMNQRRQWLRRLLVPLAGRLADEALVQPIVEAARSAGSTVRLLYVRPHPARGLEAEGSRYLDAVAARLGDIPVERVIRYGNLESAILNEAAAWGADLVALSAGERTWLSRAVRAGTAARAFRQTGIPALLYTPRPAEGS